MVLPFLALAATFVQRSGTILAILVEGHPRNTSWQDTGISTAQ